jgi:hypothetical protein
VVTTVENRFARLHVGRILSIPWLSAGPDPWLVFTVGLVRTGFGFSWIGSDWIWFGLDLDMDMEQQWQGRRETARRSKLDIYSIAIVTLDFVTSNAYVYIYFRVRI